MERLDEVEVVRRSQPSADDRVPRVVDEVVPVDDRQAGQRVTVETCTQRVVVGHAHEAVTAGVDDHRRIGRRQRDARLRRVEQQLRFDTVDRQVNRYDEHRWVVGIGVGESLLAQHQLVAVETCRDERVTRLPDPRVHQRTHRYCRVGLLDRVPQIAGLGVAVGVCLQVQADALAERFGAEVLLEHPQQ